MTTGLINLNKPPGITSAHAVNVVKRLLPRGAKIGHAGTLDPFATGVLLLLVGKATKLCESLMSTPKQYEAVIKLGATTATDDLESPEEPFLPSPALSIAQMSARNDVISTDTIQRLLPDFTGDILQAPPVYSALKIKGKRACDRARAGESVPIEPRRVKVYRIEIMDFTYPHLQLRIDCGRGTYIRSLARDLGAALGVGGYLTALTRTRIGDYDLNSAVTLDQLKLEGIEAFLLPPSKP